MRVVILLLILAASVLAQDANDAKRINPSNCGRRIGPTTRPRPAKITGGTEARPGDWGWQVALTQNNIVICGGVLINSQWVLTAAHCLSSTGGTEIKLTEMKALIGVHDTSYPSQTRNIHAKYMYPLYISGLLQFDIALLKLKQPVNYTNSIVPACLSNVSSNYGGANVTATGFGQSIAGNGLESSRILKEVQLTGFETEMCQQYFNDFNWDTLICTADHKKGTCQGDSGGPLVVKHDDDNKWHLIGLTSFGNCGDSPSVFSKISYFLNWITSTIATS